MLRDLVMKLSLGCQLGFFHDYFYIKAKLTMIDLQKVLLTLDLEQGQEVFVPRDLN